MAGMRPLISLGILATLLGASPAGAEGSGAPPARPVEVTGRLTVHVADDFARGQSQRRYMLEDERSGERWELEFEGGTPPGLLTGERVRARGLAHGRRLVLEANGDGGSVDVIAPAQLVVSGEQPTLVMVTNFRDADVTCPVSDVRDLVFTDPLDQSVDDLYQETSFGETWLTGDAVGPVTIDYSGDTCDFSAWGAAADAAARASGVDPDAYMRKLYVLPPSACPAVGIGTVGGNPSQAWVFRCGIPDVYAHELGHNMGMQHAATPTSEYGDNTDVMGLAQNRMRQINAPHKEQMGWLPGIPLGSGGRYSLAPLELDPLAVTAPQSLRIEKPDTGEFYYLSYRSAIGFDANLVSTQRERVSVHRYEGDGSVSKTYLLALLDDGQSFVDDVNQITVTQLSHGPAGAEIDVAFGDPTCTLAQPDLRLSPSSQSGPAGAPLAYTVSVTNADGSPCPSSTFALDGVAPSGWGATVSPSSLSLAPQETGLATLWATSAGSAADGTYGVGVDATDTARSGHGGSVRASYVIATACEKTAPDVALAPSLQAGAPGDPLVYELSVTNPADAGCDASTFSLEPLVRLGWTATPSADTLTLAPGETGRVGLQVSSPLDALDGPYDFSASATDALDAGRSASAVATYEVVTGAADTEPPSAPTGLVAAHKGRRVALSWTASRDDVGVAGYVVWRDGARLGETSGVSFDDHSVASGSTYAYQVTAFDAAGNVSAPSNTASVTTRASHRGRK